MRTRACFFGKAFLLRLTVLPVLLIFANQSVVHCSEMSASTNIVWGAATNGMRLGVGIDFTKTGPGLPPICALYVQNISTNFQYLRLPEVEDRHCVELRGQDGQQIPRRRGTSFSTIKRVRWRSLSPSQVAQVDHFSVAETFQVKTNGAYSLAVSTRAAASPVAANLWKKDATYFSLFGTNSLVIELPRNRNQVSP
jgi:hypothetical protein